MAIRLRLAAAGCMAVLAGCRTPLPGSAQRTRELRTVEESLVIALQENDRLALRFRIKGRDAYAVAALPDGATEARTVMEFTREAKDQFSAARKHRRPLPVLGARAWRELSRVVAAELAPVSPRQCALVATGGLELLACRDAAGIPGFRSLTDRPRAT